MPKPTPRCQFVLDAVERARAMPESTEECILWPFGLDAQGYGHCRYEGKMWRTHILAAFLAYGERPDGYVVAHAPTRCHNRACLNPRHLRYASTGDNNRDRARDGTDPSGMRNGRSRLNEQRVHFIRLSSLPVARLAAMFGVHTDTVRLVRSGGTWSSLHTHGWINPTESSNDSTGEQQ